VVGKKACSHFGVKTQGVVVCGWNLKRRWIEKEAKSGVEMLSGGKQDAEIKRGNGALGGCSQDGGRSQA